MCESKFCKKCGETKPRSQFSKDAGKRDGLYAYCKACDSIANAVLRASHPEKKRARNAKWYAANTEKAKARVNAWQAANPEKVNASSARWYLANPGRKRAARAAWFSANPEARRIYKHNRRAREAGGKLSPGLSEKLFRLQRGKCACCKTGLGENYHRDHRMPLALGGANEDWNIQLLCQTCNQQKHIKHPIDFMQQLGFLL